MVRYSHLLQDPGLAASGAGDGSAPHSASSRLLSPDELHRAGWDNRGSSRFRSSSSPSTASIAMTATRHGGSLLGTHAPSAPRPPHQRRPLRLRRARSVRRLVRGPSSARTTTARRAQPGTRGPAVAGSFAGKLYPLHSRRRGAGPGRARVRPASAAREAIFVTRRLAGGAASNAPALLNPLLHRDVPAQSAPLSAPPSQT